MLKCLFPAFSIGIDWLNGFMKQHNLTKQITDNVKAACAEVNAKVINNYFDHLEETRNNIPPSNIFNYDETNVTDDPGAQTVNSFIFTTIGLGSLHLRLFKTNKIHQLKYVACFQLGIQLFLLNDSIGTYSL